MEDYKTILLVDVAHDGRRLLAIHLEGLGLKVLEAENLEQIQNALKVEKVDIVVTEWALAGLPNEFLIPALGATQRPIIIFTDLEMGNVLPLANARVKAVISKRRRYELLDLISKTMKPAEPPPSMKALMYGRRILLMEDSTVVRHFIKRAVESEHPDWIIYESADTKKALGDLASKAVDLIVADLDIPGTGGAVFIKYLREKPELRHKPIVALKAGSLREIKDELKNDAHVIFLPKPVIAGQVLDCIHRVFNAKPIPAKVGGLS